MAQSASAVDSGIELQDQRMRDAHTMPRTDDDLRDWIAAYCGIKIPHVAVCEGHQSPMQAIADLFFERVPMQVWFASRTAGKTRNLSVVHHLNLMF